MSQDAKRLLNVLYFLAGGSTEQSVKQDALADYCRTNGIFDMSDQEYEAWRWKHVEPIKAQREARGER